MPPTHPNQEGRIESESFSFLNELARAFRSGESNPRPSHFPVLEGIRAVLTHLTTAGRLIPAGGMALTAEQVEDVRTVLDWVQFHAPLGKDGRDLRAAYDRLREGGFGSVGVVPNPEHPYLVWEQGYQAAVTDSDAGVDGTRGNAYTSNPYSLGESEADPATEPVEEETKAELCAVRLCVLPAGHSGVHADREGLRWNNPTSSPVVPAPTETGPWQTWQEVPEGVPFKSHNGMDVVWRREGALVWFKHFRQDARDLNDLAPFVAAEEG